MQSLGRVTVTNLLRNRAVRLPLVSVVTAAYFGISNQCAVGRLQAEPESTVPKCHAPARWSDIIGGTVMIELNIRDVPFANAMRTGLVLLSSAI
ncbi:MAG: hypothetical protein DMF23_08150 [Verrucomicrobia bacterium]|nr:MAG: hypothetical protein DME37_10905 [Verrucomicrobiota bacterium]PYL83829.1 MAG: hypothetical protein DMF23_08150 [Verrucomicrobiota bacterium]